MEEYKAYVSRTRQELEKMLRGTKKWWSKTQEILQEKGKTCNIPALKESSSSWTTDAVAKANLFAEKFTNKYALEAREFNEYSALCELAPQGK